MKTPMMHPQPISALQFGAKASGFKTVPYEGLNVWSDDNYDPNLNEPKAKWVTQQELRQICDSMPTIAIWPPPPPININGKVGIKISALSRAGSQSIYPTKVEVNTKTKTLKLSVNQDVSNGGMTMQVSTTHCALMMDEKALPKDYKIYKLVVNLKEV
jgi:hypothetical protein